MQASGPTELPREQASQLVSPSSSPPSSSHFPAQLPGFLRLASLVIFPPRWMRLFALLMAVTGVAMLFYLGAKPFAGGMFSHPVDKLVHLVAFGGLASVLWVMLGGRGRWADHGAVILAGLVGTADETIQRMIPTRQASMADLVFDLLGILLVVGLLVYGRGWLMRQHQRRAGARPGTG